MERDRRIVTIPNLISVVRLLCAPVFVWLLADDQGIAAAAVLAVLGASDWVDGWIARRFDQGSDLGKVLDPVADRVLLLVAAVALSIDGSVPIVVGVLVLVREAVVSIAVLVLAMAGARRIDVQWAGKAGTLSVMFAFPLFLLADNITSGHDLVARGRVVLRRRGPGPGLLRGDHVPADRPRRAARRTCTPATC